MSLDFSSLAPAEQQALLDGPALAPPPGVVPDFHSPPNKNEMAYVIYGVCFLLGSLVVALRTYSTWYCARKAYLGDCKELEAYLLIPTSSSSMVNHPLPYRSNAFVIRRYFPPDQALSGCGYSRILLTPCRASMRRSWHLSFTRSISGTLCTNGISV
jgi:hypothetical protein